MILSEKPDVISLCIIMIGMDGIKFLKKIQKHYPIPTVIVSYLTEKNGPITERAYQLGAVGVLDQSNFEYPAIFESRIERKYVSLLRTAGKHKTLKKVSL